ncbi:MAG: hypothetical protein AAB525_00595 [Patescibacteria group bacterium]
MPKIFIISGPSRSGKNAIIDGLLNKQELNLERAITATTRQPRNKEVQGRDYYFLVMMSLKSASNRAIF